MKQLFLAITFWAGLLSTQAAPSVSSWTPIFRGVDQATGTNNIGYTGRPLSVNAVRIDLQDPDVRLLVTPPITNNYVPDQRETFLQKPGEFLRAYRLQVAVNSVFFSPGGYNLPSGTPAYLRGLAISEGRLVSAQTSTTDALSALLVTTNNQASFVYLNWPPANTAGIFTAIAGMYPLVSNSVNISFQYTNMMNDTTHQAQPRTAFGLSEDARYIIVVTIDGRQGDFSSGAVDYETADFLLRFGAHNGINVDGGGSTCLDKADVCGNPIQINQNSYQAAVGRPGDERPVGCNFGVYAKPLPGFINDLAVVAGDTNAVISWTTVGEADTQVEYGLTLAYGQVTLLDPALVTNHSVSLSGLVPSTNYFFRVISRADPQTHYALGCFSTTNLAGEIRGLIFDLPNFWRYNYTNHDGQNWKAPAFNDTNWPSGRGLLYNDTGALGGPKNTLLPLNPGVHCLDATAVNYPYPTYYFRTHFAFSNNPVGAVLTFSNYLDDGAAFYLNGVEIHRAFIPATPAVIPYCSLANGYPPCGGDATCPYIFTVSGNRITNLVQGDNVLAVEVHNYQARSPDIAFGSALSFVALPFPPPPPFIGSVEAVPGETNATITWTTLSNATTQIEYGLSTNLGNSTPLDSTLVTNHSVTLNSLTPETPYYFRVVSTMDTNAFTTNGQFATLSFYQNILPLTAAWRYTTNDLTGQNWMAPNYDATNWLGEGPALLHIENNTGVYPRNTPLPGMTVGGQPNLPAPTYYFRTRFPITNIPPGLSLNFSNYVDDGAVFYLNGVEIQRLRLPPPPVSITYTQLALAVPQSEDAIYPDVFRVGGDVLTNLFVGTNLLAAEVHQITPTNSDVVFGSAVGFVRALVSETRLRVTHSNRVVCIWWDGLGFTLQHAPEPDNSNAWNDVPGAATTSPYCVTNPPASVFYRLRK